MDGSDRVDMNHRASQMLRRDNSLRWTPHMDESLQLFIEQPECEGDKILSVQVRCALISEQLNDLLIKQSLSGESHISTYFIKALDGQLQEIWRTLPDTTATTRSGESFGGKSHKSQDTASA